MRTATKKVSSRTAVKKRISAKTATRKTVATKKATAKKTAVKKANAPLATTKKITKVTTPAQATKVKKAKLVRDSFTIPKSELLQIGESKKRALELGVEIKKSELIRAGLQALTRMNDVAFKKALASVPTIKTGRPAKS